MIALTDLALGRAPLASEEIRWVAAEHTSHDPLHPMLAIEPLKLALELLLATLLDRQSSGGALP